MKPLKLGLVIVAAVAITIGLGGMAYAFHSGGVANCDGCHSMHGVVNTDGSITTTTQNYLLANGATESETCLNCHGNATQGSYHVMTTSTETGGIPPVNYTPGGDFAWILKNFTPVSGQHWSAALGLGDRHGHNINAPAYGIQTDLLFTKAPGGSFVSANLACTSCHDPHGKYRRMGGTGDTGYTIGTSGAPIIGSGSYATSLIPGTGQAVGAYRLLAGSGYVNNGVTIGFQGSPVACVPSSYNPTGGEASSQTRVAYGVSAASGATTWGQWCAACHTGYVVGVGSHSHPVDVGLGSSIASNYNAYVSSGVTGNTSATSYLSLVPFATNSDSYTVLKGLAVNAATSAGPAAGDQVICFSCHRAHASAFAYMLRWDASLNEFVTDGTPNWELVDTALDNGSSTSGSGGVAVPASEANAAYYGRAATTFGAYQRSLCNKCHAQD